MSETKTVNPAIFDWNGLNGLPRFDLVADEDFAPAFEVALARHEAEIDAVANQTAAPDFANTIIALEVAGDDLLGSRLSSGTVRVPIPTIRSRPLSVRSRRRCRATIPRSA